MSVRSASKRFKGKLAVFTDCFDQINGVSRTYQNLCQFCIKTNRRLDLFTHGKETGIEELGPVKILRFKPRIPFRYYTDLAFDLPIFFPEILRHCRKTGYDLIHTATPGSIGLNALWIAKRLNIPLVGCYHTALPEYADERRKSLLGKLRFPESRCSSQLQKAVWRILRAYYRHCDMILVPTKTVGKAVAENIRVPVRIFRRGVDSSRFSPTFRKSSNSITAIYVGRIAPEKNLDLLMKLFQKRRDITLKLVGDGPYRKKIEKSAENIIFTGFLTGDALSEAYASADFFLFPSETDTFGNVVLEAMSSGLPVIVSDKMGPKELVKHGENGFIARNTQAFEDYVNRLSSDSILRNRMGWNARITARYLGWDSIFRRLFEEYQLVWEHTKSRRPIPGQIQTEFKHNWGTV
jgi:glycosyltransferase involved in cell wall biosynthesis